MALTIGDTASDFDVDTTEGPINFHDWIGDGWPSLFSPIRATSLRCAPPSGLPGEDSPDFDSRNTKVIGLSVDPLDNHEQWDIAETQGRRSISR